MEIKKEYIEKRNRISDLLDKKDFPEDPELNFEQKQAIINDIIGDKKLAEIQRKDGIKKSKEIMINQFLKEEKDKEKLEKNIEEMKETLKEAYGYIVEMLKKYCDIDERYYSLIAIWIIGTYFHKEFNSYPYLFLNAMKGSGKTRLLKLISYLSKDGEIVASLTEAVLFRTKGTLCIDEIEGLTRKGFENVRELLNASYKKGSKVKRMRKKRTNNGEEQIVEEFDIYRPISMANIWGMESVLGDRCISIIIERSNNYTKTKLIENYENDFSAQKARNILKNVVWCSVVVAGEMYTEWNNYILEKYSNYITTHTNNYTKLHSMFEKINSNGLDGRSLELSLPLLLIADSIDKKIFNELTETLKEIFNEKKQEEFVENKDINFIDFISKQEKEEFIPIRDISEKLNDFSDGTEFFNNKWVGRALKRLNLIKEKKRTSQGISVVLNIEKAKEKIKIFR